MEDSRNAFKTLIGKFVSKRKLGRPKRWEDDNKMDLAVKNKIMNWISWLRISIQWGAFVYAEFSIRVCKP